MGSDDFDTKSTQIRQLSSLPMDQLTEHLANTHPMLDTVAPGIAPHVHAAASNAIQFLASKLPNMGNELPEDDLPTISKSNKKDWMDLHEAVSNPLSVLDHAKNGTLTQNHVAALKTVYPDLHQEIVQKLQSELTEHKENGGTLSNSRKRAIGMLMEAPLDSNHTFIAAQTIMNANAGAQRPQTAQQTPKKATGVELKQIDKTDDLYQTSDQAREMRKRS
jgi:hypothetical protein